MNQSSDTSRASMAQEPATGLHLRAVATKPCDNVQQREDCSVMPDLACNWRGIYSPLHIAEPAVKE
jgi:hypothetical protein